VILPGQPPSGNLDTTPDPDAPPAEGPFGDLVWLNYAPGWPPADLVLACVERRLRHESPRAEEGEP